jgi:hypothetical protein
VPATPAGIWLSTHLHSLDAAAAQLAAAYEENSDPLWKAWAIRRALDQVLWTIGVHFGEVTRNEETIVEVARLMYAYAAPPRLASAFSFASEFLGGSPADWAYFGGRELGSLCTLLQRLMEEWFSACLPGMGLWTLSRDLQRQRCLAFFEHGKGSPDTCAARFFALLTHLQVKDVEGILGLALPTDPGRAAPPVAVIPDPRGSLGATVLSLCKLTEAGQISTRFTEESKGRLAVAVYSVALADIGFLFSFSTVQQYFANAPIRILMYHTGSLSTEQVAGKIADLNSRIAEAAENSGWRGVELIDWKQADETRDEIINVLRQGFGHLARSAG